MTSFTEALIERAGFDDDDRDIGTSGLCGMFALALYRAVIDQHPTLVLIGGLRDGKPVMAKNGGRCWAHAALKVAGNYYDIEGEQPPQQMFDNYAWTLLHLGVEPAVLELSPEEFIKEMRTTKSARDWRYYTRWREQLMAAKA